MPELPEVTALASLLDERMRGNAIETLQIVGISTLKTVSPSPADLAGAVVDSVSRRGKFILITTAAGIVAIHLARAGWIRWRDDVTTAAMPRKTPIAARLRLNNGAGIEITEQGHEKHLSVHIVKDAMDVPGIARLGIDALDPAFDTARLAKILHDSGAGQLKTVLADQSLIAGIGNAYSDEILHTARLSPFQPAARLDDEGLERLHTAIATTLTNAIAATDGREPRDLKDTKRGGLRVHGRTGEACPVCGDVIRHVDTGRRVFQYCPGCQTGGRVYADRRLSKLLK